MAKMVDPCGADAPNEFIVLNSGTGFNTRDLQISFDPSGNGQGPQNNDININIDNFPGDTRPCRFQPGNPNLIEGCDNIRVVSQDEEIPPNAIVIIQLSGNAGAAFDFSDLCGNGECVYVLQNDCIRTIEAFTNRGSGTRSTLVALRGTLCSDTYTYDRSLLDNQEGAFYAPEGINIYGNRGCGRVPPLRGATIPPEFVNPGLLIGCGSLILPSITGLNLTGGERYYTAPGGRGNIITPGSVITRSTTLFIYDRTAPCSPEEFFRVTILDPIIPALSIPEVVCTTDGPVPLDTRQSGVDGNWSGPGVSNNRFDPAAAGPGVHTLTFVPDPDECADENTIDIEVIATPTSPDSLIIASCGGTNTGLGFFDLTAYAAQINGGTNQPVVWYEDGAGADVIVDSMGYVSTAGRIYARVENSICPGPLVPVDLRVGINPFVTFTNFRNLSCNGDTDGAIDIEVNGGTPPYDIRWSDPAYDGLLSITDLSAGPYSVTVTDSQGCTYSTTATLIEPPLLTLTCDKLQDVGTVISEDGEAGFLIAGGLPPYRLIWNGPVSDSMTVTSPGVPVVINTFRAGVYEVRVRDVLGCVTFCAFEIDAPACDLEIGYSSVAPSCADAADGSITVTANGGQGALTYSWNEPALEGQAEPTQLAAGVYEVTVTDEIGCAVTTSITLSAPPPLDVSCGVSTPVSILGGRDGRARIEVGGGTAPYTTTWTGPRSGESLLPTARAFVIDSLPAGTYLITLTDANGCRETCSVVMPDGGCPGTLSLDSSPERCPGANNGTIELNLGGNWVAPLTIDWNDDQYDGQTTLTNLAPGTYSVTVSGANGCQASASATITTAFTLPNISFSPEAAVCRGDCYAYELTFTGTPPFFAEFLVRSNGQNIPINVDAPQATATLTICPADYGVNSGDLLLQVLRVSDRNCFNDQPKSSTLSVRSPVETDFSPTLCPNEHIEVNGQRYDRNRPTGTEILSGLAWNGCDSIVNISLNFDEAFIIDITDTICPDEQLTFNGNIYNIDRPSGTELIAADNGCDSLIRIDLSFYPPASGRLEQILCPGEALLINGTVYDVQNPGGTEILPNAAANGCDSILEISLQFYEEARGVLHPTICPGESVVLNGQTYDVSRPTGTEILPGQARNGCDSIVDVSLSFYEEPTGLLSQTICPGDAITVNGQLYDMNRPTGIEVLAGQAANGCDSILQIALEFFPTPVTTLVDTLCPDGSLTINGTVYDISRPSGLERLAGAAANGCDSLLEINLIFQEDVTVALIGDQDICRGEEAVLEFRITNALAPVDIQYAANGAAPTWIYGVQDGDLITVRPTTSTTYSITQALVPPEFCTVAITGDAEVRVSDLMVDAVTESDYFGYGLSCADARDGTIGIRILSGEGPFTYRWQDGSTARERTNLGPGVYSVLVTDAFGCTAEALAQLEPPPPIRVELTALPPDCSGLESGILVLDTVFGGIPPYTFQLAGGPEQSIAGFPVLAPGLSPGNYTVIISDEFGCSTAENFVIPDFSPLELQLAPDQTIRFGESVRLDGVANFTIDSLYWRATDSLPIAPTLPVTVQPADDQVTYTLTAYDERGCPVEDHITITVLRENDIYVPSAFSPNGDGLNDRIYPFTNPNIKEIVEFRIFDRWGNQMHRQTNFQGNQEQFGWDGRFNGRKMDPAVFIFFIRYLYLDDREGVIKGDFALVR